MPVDHVHSEEHFRPRGLTMESLQEWLEEVKGRVPEDAHLTRLVISTTGDHNQMCQLTVRWFIV